MQKKSLMTWNLQTERATKHRSVYHQLKELKKAKHYSRQRQHPQDEGQLQRRHTGSHLTSQSLQNLGHRIHSQIFADTKSETDATTKLEKHTTGMA